MSDVEAQWHGVPPPLTALLDAIATFLAYDVSPTLLPCTFHSSCPVHPPGREMGSLSLYIPWPSTIGIIRSPACLLFGERAACQLRRFSSLKNRPQTGFRQRSTTNRSRWARATGRCQPASQRPPCCLL